MKYHMKHCLKYFLLAIALLVMTISGSSISKAESILPEEANQQHQFISVVEANQQYQSISPQDAKAELDSDASIILLDVRNPHEHDASHIPNSILVPLNTLNADIHNHIPDKTRKIFVYCRSGGRSKRAAYQLIDLGYTNVYDLLGGILAWPYDTESNL